MEELPAAVGRYVVKEKLGRGRWGVVYRAYDPELDRCVALKHIPLTSEAQRKRWRREAQVTANLSHPHIVPIYDAAQTGTAAYMVMELLTGGTLRDRLTAPFAWQDGVSLLLPVCDALAYAHRQGIVHRDVKPENILFSDSNLAKLVDFGIAYVVGASRLTSGGAGVGTFCYAAPEQIQGEAVDGRADVFALAAVLYELLTGQAVFAGEYPHVIYQIIQPEPVDLSPLQASVPPFLLNSLGRALAKNPANRCTAAEFGATLRRCLDQGGAGADRVALPINSSPPLAAQAERQAPVIEEQDRYTLTYRAAEARQVMGWVKAGQSGCLVGLRGAGKSNFFRFLLREDVRQHYLGHDYANFAFVLVNLLTTAEWSKWAVFESMLGCLLEQFHAWEEKGQTAKDMASLHQEVMRTSEPLTAQRAVERCVNALCQRPAQRIILLFDEFDTAFQTLDPSLFRCLRAIRDAHKGQLSYIVVTTDELGHLRDDLTQVEHFYRLVSHNVCGLGPYSEADALQMVRHLASRRSVELSEQDATHLVRLSGGHAGLLKATMSLLWDERRKDSLAELAPTLTSEPAVQAECQKVWDSLPGGEQAALCALTGGAQVDPRALGSIKRKGLVPAHQGRTAIFSPLFAQFVQQQTVPSKERIVIDRFLGKVTIDGQRVELTELEYEMLCYLYEHRGQVCTKDELIENVYHQQYDRTAGGIDDARLQTLISRLRTKVEPPRYIVTVRGEGYKFVASET